MWKTGGIASRFPTRLVEASKGGNQAETTQVCLAGISQEVVVRKRLISTEGQSRNISEGNWLALEEIAQVELTSEDPAFPIENALSDTETTGWRAAGPGPQVIRLLFERPQTIRRIQVHFLERVSERNQEFAVLAKQGGDFREVLRQQWNFSPHGTTEEIEDYNVALDGVVALELKIDPDRTHDPKQSKHVASLQRLRLA